MHAVSTNQIADIVHFNDSILLDYIIRGLPKLENNSNGGGSAKSSACSYLLSGSNIDFGTVKNFGLLGLL